MSGLEIATLIGALLAVGYYWLVIQPTKKK